MSLDAHDMLAALAVDLLSGPDRDLALGARRARERRLAGLFLHGVGTRTIATGWVLDTQTRVPLERAARGEEIQDAVAAQEFGIILSLLSGLDPPPVVLKGRLLAHQVWPRAWHRPSSDLDLLVGRADAGPVIATLVAAGYRMPHPHPLREISGLLLQCPPDRVTPVDLHWRPFRSVGRGIDAEGLLERAQTTTLEGRRVRILDEPDRLLHLLVHSVTHGLRRTKWVLDLYGSALQADVATWREVIRRALASRSTRPVFAAASVIAGLPGSPVDPGLLRSIRPPWPVRPALARLVSLEGGVRENDPTR